MSYERRVTVQPGYNCHVECPHTPKSRDHGCCVEMWWFSVIGTIGAVELKVSSGIYPASTGYERKPIEALDLFGHSRYPLTEEPIRSADAGEKCCYLGTCFSDYETRIISHGQEVWALGDPKAAPHAQPEAFWLALEKACAELEAHITKARVDTKLLQCPSCTGKGIVERGEPPAPARLNTAGTVLHSHGSYGAGVLFCHDNGARYEISRLEAAQLHAWLGRYLASVEKPEKR